MAVYYSTKQGWKPTDKSATVIYINKAGKTTGKAVNIEGVPKGLDIDAPIRTSSGYSSVGTEVAKSINSQPQQQTKITSQKPQVQSAVETAMVNNQRPAEMDKDYQGFGYKLTPAQQAKARLISAVTGEQIPESGTYYRALTPKGEAFLNENRPLTNYFPESYQQTQFQNPRPRPTAVQITKQLFVEQNKPLVRAYEAYPLVEKTVGDALFNSPLTVYGQQNLYLKKNFNTDIPTVAGEVASRVGGVYDKALRFTFKEELHPLFDQARYSDFARGFVTETLYDIEKRPLKNASMFAMGFGARQIATGVSRGIDVTTTAGKLLNLGKLTGEFTIAGLYATNEGRKILSSGTSYQLGKNIGLTTKDMILFGAGAKLGQTSNFKELEYYSEAVTQKVSNRVNQFQENLMYYNRIGDPRGVGKYQLTDTEYGMIGKRPATDKEILQALKEIKQKNYYSQKIVEEEFLSDKNIERIRKLYDYDVEVKADKNTRWINGKKFIKASDEGGIKVYKRVPETQYKNLGKMMADDLYNVRARLKSGADIAVYEDGRFYIRPNRAKFTPELMNEYNLKRLDAMELAQQKAKDEYYQKISDAFNTLYDKIYREEPYKNQLANWKTDLTNIEQTELTVAKKQYAQRPEMNKKILEALKDIKKSGLYENELTADEIRNINLKRLNTMEESQISRAFKRIFPPDKGATLGQQQLVRPEQELLVKKVTKLIDIDIPTQFTAYKDSFTPTRIYSDIQLENIKMFNVLAPIKIEGSQKIINTQKITQPNVMIFKNIPRVNDVPLTGDVDIGKVDQSSFSFSGQSSGSRSRQSFSQSQPVIQPQLQPQPQPQWQYPRDIQKIYEPFDNSFQFERLDSNLNLDLKKRKKKGYQLKKVPVYSLQIKRKGKFKTVSTDLTRPQALKLGSQRIFQNLGRTFKVVKTGEKETSEFEDSFLPDTNLFREYKIKKGKKVMTPDQFVQRNIVNLSTSSERQELKNARNLKKLINLY